MDVLADYRNLHPWFEVLQTVEVPRSFGRDKRDVIYVDHVARFVKIAAGRGVCLYMNEIPLYVLQEYILGRLWNRLTEAYGLLQAIKFGIRPAALYGRRTWSSKTMSKIALTV